MGGLYPKALWKHTHTPGRPSKHRPEFVRPHGQLVIGSSAPLRRVPPDVAGTSANAWVREPPSPSLLREVGRASGSPAGASDEGFLQQEEPGVQYSPCPLCPDTFCRHLCKCNVRHKKEKALSGETGSLLIHHFDCFSFCLLLVVSA